MNNHIIVLLAVSGGSLVLLWKLRGGRHKLYFGSLALALSLGSEIGLNNNSQDEVKLKSGIKSKKKSGKGLRSGKIKPPKKQDTTPHNLPTGEVFKGVLNRLSPAGAGAKPMLDQEITHQDTYPTYNTAVPDFKGEMLWTGGFKYLKTAPNIEPTKINWQSYTINLNKNRKYKTPVFNKNNNMDRAMNSDLDNMFKQIQDILDHDMHLNNNANNQIKNLPPAPPSSANVLANNSILQDPNTIIIDAQKLENIIKYHVERYRDALLADFLKNKIQIPTNIGGTNTTDTSPGGSDSKGTNPIKNEPSPDNLGGPHIATSNARPETTSSSSKNASTTGSEKVSDEDLEKFIFAQLVNNSDLWKDGASGSREAEEDFDKYEENNRDAGIKIQPFSGPRLDVRFVNEEQKEKFGILIKKPAPKDTKARADGVEDNFIDFRNNNNLSKFANKNLLQKMVANYREQNNPFDDLETRLNLQRQKLKKTSSSVNSRGQILRESLQDRLKKHSTLLKSTGSSGAVLAHKIPLSIDTKVYLRRLNSQRQVQRMDRYLHNPQVYDKLNELLSTHSLVDEKTKDLVKRHNKISQQLSLIEKKLNHKNLSIREAESLGYLNTTYKKLSNEIFKAITPETREQLLNLSIKSIKTSKPQIITKKIMDL